MANQGKERQRDGKNDDMKGREATGRKRKMKDTQMKCHTKRWEYNGGKSKGKEKKQQREGKPKMRNCKGEGTQMGGTENGWKNKGHGIN